MALQINFHNQTDGIKENAYVKPQAVPHPVQKTGDLIFSVWNDEECRTAGRRTINRVSIPINELDTKVDEDTGVVESVNYYEYIGVSWEDFYINIKKLKLLVEGDIVDLSTAVDI